MCSKPEGIRGSLRAVRIHEAAIAHLCSKPEGIRGSLRWRWWRGIRAFIVVLKARRHKGQSQALVSKSFAAARRCAQSPKA